MINNKKAHKPRVVYFHRYPVEFEAVQFPAAKAIFEELGKKYELTYFSMKSRTPDRDLRKMIKIKEIPLFVDQTKFFDKWFKTGLYYLFLPITLLRLKRINPDFIICQETLPFVPSLIGILGKPYSLAISDWWWSILFGKRKIGKKFANFMEKIEVSHWNKWKSIAIAHTKAEAKMVEQKGLSHKKIKIIHVPMPDGLFFPYNASSERKKLGIKKNDWVVAVHGIIHPSKGYDQILKWWKKVVDVYGNWKFLIIGGAGGEDWCKKLIKKLNIGRNVIMTGWLPKQSDVNRYLNAADCLLVTRRNTGENVGIIPSSLYHSMPTGKPTVATGLEGHAEIITHGVDGFLYEPDHFESFKSILEHLYKNPKIARKIGEAGIKRANECFSSKKTAINYREIVDNSLVIKKK